MKLVPEWQVVLRKAWSVRLQVVAAALGALELALNLLTPIQPSGWFIGLAVVVNIASTISRIVYQPKMEAARAAAAAESPPAPAPDPLGEPNQ